MGASFLRRFGPASLCFSISFALLGIAPSAFADGTAKKRPSKSKAAKSKKKEAEDPAFRERFAKLRDAQKGPIAIRMRPADDPETIPNDALPPGMMLVAGRRSGIYTPPVLSPDDMLSVVNEHMNAMRRCYKKQLADDPDWSGDLILDLSVKKTGRISEVGISPGRVERDTLGQCLMSEIPKWKFPEFTGEVDGGINQEVVNASFPFAFSRPN